MLDYGAETKAVVERPRLAASRDAPKAHSSVTLAGVVALALRSKLFILSVAFVCAVIGFAISKTLSPRYIAAAQIYLDPRGLPGLERDGNPGQDSTGFINFVETQTRIITSQAVLERAVKMANLADDSEFGGGISLMGRLLGIPPSSEAERVAGAVRTLGARVIVRRPERTFIIDIAATSNNADKSARIANAVAQAYIDVRESIHADSARQATNSFTGRLEDLREKVLVAEKHVEAYKAENGFIGTRDTYMDEQRMKELNQQLTYARTRLEDTRSRYEQAQRARRSDTELAAIASGMNLVSLNNLRAQQAEASQRLADLSSDLGPQHPVVKNANARLAETRRLVSAELSRVADSLRKEYERARSTEEALTRDVHKLENKAVDTAQASVKLRDLEREVEVSRSIYESFLQRSRQTGEARQLDAASTHIITMATPPVARSFPPGSVTMAGGGFCIGLALGLGVAFLRARGAAPPAEMETRRIGGALAAPESLAVTSATRFTVRGPAGSSVRLELTRLGIPFVRPFADRREIDAVAARLSSLAAEERRPLIVGFVGDAPGAVRTIMSFNLALALRLEDFDVALVDADEGEATLTVLIEDGLEALGDSRSPYVETRDGVLLALPSIVPFSRAGRAVERIVDEFRDGRPTRVDVVICDGVGADEALLERVDCIVPVLGCDQSEKKLSELPEALRAKVALVLRFDHPDPWLPRREMRREPTQRDPARKSA
jgi:uncharacterized protein involved in exopolysaccharide biosynthesis